eukprot:TRINITY_DN2329_c0_g1_i1.p1 TRINITY_DN2329_c0_g1~~TRINITY_DN2329_c0_g1_i1.p1  ORF type:complete len:169 (+),score=19.73 TRINITY_DN2329_c0_g1_i1:222-728(+)
MPLCESITHTYKHSWADVSMASWKKYPCAERPDVLSVDIIEKKYDEATGVLTGKRIIINKSKIPSWINMICRSSGLLLFYEEFTVDPKNQVMILKSKNLSFTSTIQSEEVCSYTIDPQNPNWTQLRQDMTVTAFPRGIRSRLESYSATKFREYAQYGQALMESAILRG